MTRPILACALAAGLLAACESLPPARMALPSALQAGNAMTLPVDGIGGARTGRFRAGAYSGDFRRSEERLAFFDPLFEMRDGGASFTLAGPEIEGAIKADCRMQKRTLTIGVASFQTKPMAYACAFSQEGRPMPARFEVQEVHEGLGGALMREERRGEIALDDTRLQIRSVHTIAGSPFELASPIGYVFEQDGRPLGAVEVNGAPVISLAPGADAEAQRAIVIGAMALGLFWDPANSAL